MDKDPQLSILLKQLDCDKSKVFVYIVVNNYLLKDPEQILQSVQGMEN